MERCDRLVTDMIKALDTSASTRKEPASLALREVLETRRRALALTQKRG